MYRSSKSGAALFAGFALAIAIIAAGAGTASAQRYGRNWDGYPNWGGGHDLRQTALNAGYNEGNREGSNDRARGRFTSNYNDFSSYRNANKDYNSRLGDRTLYQRYFRLAFGNGYADATGTSAATDGIPNNDWDRDRGRGRGRGRGRNWDGYPNLGGSRDLRQTALNAGYNAGHKEGMNDRNRRRSATSDFNRFNSYRNANGDYNSRLGDRYLYQRYFRAAFENGYADGYDGY
jgi:hypothetical protein